MKFTAINATSNSTHKLFQVFCGVGFSLLMAGCGGGGAVADNGGRSTSSSATAGSALRALPAGFTSSKAVAYGAYRTATGVGHPFQTVQVTDPADATKKLTKAVLDANGKCIPDLTDRANEFEYFDDPSKSAIQNLAAKQAKEIEWDALIAQDMRLLAEGKFGLIRLFASSMNVAERTLRIIQANNLGIKVMLGAYVHNYTPSLVDQMCHMPTTEVSNSEEIARAVALANSYKDIVLAVSVGNETMVSWSTVPVPPAKIAGYINTVRGQITQPVTSDDNWAFYANAKGENLPNLILGAIDFVSMHTYPELDSIYNSTIWDWRQKNIAPISRAGAMMDAAIASAYREYTAVRTYLDSKNLATMPIVIGETGWNAVNLGALTYRAHPVNQKMYFDRLTQWANEGKLGAGPKAIFYFSAFDEPWKQGDDKWGLFNAARQARYVIQGLKPAGSTTWVNESTTYTEADAIYWLPPTLNAAIDTTQVSRYTLYADAASTGELVAPVTGATALSWNAWGTTATGTHNFTGSGSSDGPNAFEIKPTPAEWGWGFFFGTTEKYSSNLSQFASKGHLQFDLKTNNYPGKLMLGVLTNTADNEEVKALIALENGNYGYCNTNVWCHVSIPLADLVKGNTADLSMVMHRFVIADDYAVTKKDFGTTGQPNIYLDKIYISKD